MTMSDESDSVDQLISRYLDGEATDEETARIERDPDLLDRVTSVRVAIEAIAAPVEIPTTELDQIRLGVVEQSATTEKVTDLDAAAARRGLRRQRGNRMMSVAAACVLLAIGVVAARSLPGNQGDNVATESFDAGDMEMDMDMDMNDDALETFSAADDAAVSEASPTAGEATAEDSAASIPPFAPVDLLPETLPAPKDAETLAESIADAYRAQDGAESGVDIAEADQYADSCLAAVDVALGTNRFEAATIEWATTELDGVVVTIAVVVGTDGSIAILRTPVDDCEPVELVAVVDPG